ncbi:PD-(D/E)XK nuclease family transposase [Clostridium tepidiprofundi DSM 19306]|uniref:PD-(D/E)XK nuclease family transposase n=1 Tax=Clostridium tepidiprofundi DSM 19306 TaxID=1121338 RepID=A0A151AGR3_9CLOT|nr:Rpn family recombination-promoting nuclease/putative transposase [Clostridium tepidiprofundi]KYH26859.1 PD-(D/E)XK nuclease family transposase [Clostridium tepidiprofundi DSM 19306]
MCRLNPKVDFVFKKLFGSEENKDILISFINSVLSEDEQIVDIELKNPYNLANYRQGKMSILDIKAVDEKGVWYDIEMQIAEQSFYDKRALYYWAKVYSDQIESGYEYNLLKKTIGINILDFEYLDEEEYHNVYKIYNVKSKKAFSNLFELHFIELPKFKKDFSEIKTTLDRWAAFLTKAYEFDKDTVPKELAQSEEIKKAAEKLDIMSLNKEEREIYENDLKAMMVRNAEINAAEEKGREEGKVEGRIEAAIEAIKLGVNNDVVAKISKLSIEKVEELRKKLAINK